MADNERPEDEQPKEPPASVVFMAMMRQHAADQTEPEPEAPPAEDLTPEDDPPPPMSEDERRRLAALEVQRLRRVQRRKSTRKQKRSGMVGGMIFSWFIVIVTGGLIATILSWSTSPESLSLELRSQISNFDGGRGVQAVTVDESGAVILPTPIPTPNYLIRIGIISGHMGPEDDPGAICDEDGLTEAEINFAVADRVWRGLRERGYTVDLLEEFDVRLDDYRADALISIHSNDCSDYGGASGFLVSKADARPDDGPDVRLMECIAQAYGARTALERRFGLTRDMTDYHIFRKIHVNTPGIILELGFMRDDRELLTTQPDLLSQAIIEGIICYLRPSQPGLSVVSTPPPSDDQG